MPRLSIVQQYMFNGCANLENVTFDAVSAIYSYAFSGCSKLASVTFPMLSFISNYAFMNCVTLKSLYLLSTSRVSLMYSSVFQNTPMLNSGLTGSFGSIYVPSSLYDSYLSYGYWSWFASRFVAIT